MRSQEGASEATPPSAWREVNQLAKAVAQDSELVVFRGYPFAWERMITFLLIPKLETVVEKTLSKLKTR